MASPGVSQIKLPTNPPPPSATRPPKSCEQHGAASADPPGPAPAPRPPPGPASRRIRKSRTVLAELRSAQPIQPPAHLAACQNQRNPPLSSAAPPPSRSAALAAGQCCSDAVLSPAGRTQGRPRAGRPACGDHRRSLMSWPASRKRATAVTQLPPARPSDAVLEQASLRLAFE